MDLRNPFRRAGVSMLSRSGDSSPFAERFSIAIYLLMALPLSAFSYLNAFELGRGFFSAQTRLLPCRWPAATFALISLVGGWALGTSRYRSRRWLVASWLVVAGGTTAAMARNPDVWWTTAAWVLCLPGLSCLPLLVSEAYRHADKPAGSPRSWARLAIGLLTAAVVSFVGNAAYVLWADPGVDLSPLGVCSVLSGVAALVMAVTAPLLAIGAAFAFVLQRGRETARPALGLIGLSVTLGISLVLLNGLAIVEGRPAQPSHVLYALALAAPSAAWLCRRIASAGDSLTEGLALSAGRVRAGAAIVVNVGLCLGAQVLIGRLHFEFAWGFRTAPLYSCLGLAASCCLLAGLPRAARAAAAAASLIAALLGVRVLAPSSSRDSAWTSYLRLDKTLGSIVRLGHHLRPQDDPALARLRRLLDRSRALASDTAALDRRPRLTLRTIARRPHVFFIVVDALRRQTYSGSAAHRRQYPGLAWMASRFVAYDNTWSSYNSTVGSVPALLAGAYNRAWYDVREEAQGDNVLTRAALPAGYRCYNVSEGGDETRRAWTGCATVAPLEGGVGMEDPEVVFPAALQAFDEHIRAPDSGPAFFYVHVYNMHQPLLRRADAPFQRSGKHWMRGLYEQNAAHLDRHLLRLLESLEARRVLDDALVVITADHGEEVFDYGGLYHGWQLNPAVAAVPLFVHYPAGQTGAPPAGRVQDRAVNLVDVAPTLCDVMGVSIQRDSPLQGTSLLEPNPPGRSFLLLSWQTRMVGRVGFSPPRMEILDAESGAVETFRSEGEAWPSVAGGADPRRLAEELAGDVTELLGDGGQRCTP